MTLTANTSRQPVMPTDAAGNEQHYDAHPESRPGQSLRHSVPTRLGPVVHDFGQALENRRQAEGIQRRSDGDQHLAPSQDGSHHGKGGGIAATTSLAFTSAAPTGSQPSYLKRHAHHKWSRTHTFPRWLRTARADIDVSFNPTSHEDPDRTRLLDETVAKARLPRPFVGQEQARPQQGCSDRLLGRDRTDG